MSFLTSLSRVQRAWLSAGILLLVVGMMVIIFLFSPLGDILKSPSTAHDRIRSLGATAPLIMLSLHVLQALAAVIPGQAIELANGYAFGWWGVPLSILGMSLGSILVLFLGRRFGRPVVELLVFSKKGMAQIHPHTRRRSVWPFLVLFLLPGIPDDLVCYALALTSIPLRRSILVAILGRAPIAIATTAIGATGRDFNPWSFAVLAVVISAILGFVWLRRKKIRKLAQDVRAG